MDESRDEELVYQKHRSPIESIIAEEQLEIVRALAERLPESEQRAFELRFNNGRKL